ncbi:penicillin-insensitive murein endopeptidase [Shigella flexneri]
MGMPAGGRFNGGRASHQTGLDMDACPATAESALSPESQLLARRR